MLSAEVVALLEKQFLESEVETSKREGIKFSHLV